MRLHEIAELQQKSLERISFKIPERDCYFYFQSGTILIDGRDSVFATGLSDLLRNDWQIKDLSAETESCKNLDDLASEFGIYRDIESDESDESMRQRLIEYIQTLGEQG